MENIAIGMKIFSQGIDRIQGKERDNIFDRDVMCFSNKHPSIHAHMLSSIKIYNNKERQKKR